MATTVHTNYTSDKKNRLSISQKHQNENKIMLLLLRKSAHRTVGLIDASEEDELREEDGGH